MNLQRRRRGHVGPRSATFPIPGGGVRGAHRRHACRWPTCLAWLWLALAIGAMAGGAAELPQAPSTDEEFFDAAVLPLLRDRCFACHSHDGAIEGGLALDSRSGWARGGGRGAAIVPGAPEESLLIQAIEASGGAPQMPPDGPIPDAERAILVDWVRRGAPDPRVTEASPEEVWKRKLTERAGWWSLQPPRFHEAPDVADAAWRREPVDRFVRAGLDSAGIQPAAPADPDTLRRRLSLVLTGLPPSFHAGIPAEATPEAIVDALLGSPHFGEHFARHWMDVVRYSDTYGYEWDIAARGSWEYRDYLVRAFNDDVGFDQLVREQIAGDLLPEPRLDRDAGVNASLIGPMFFHLGEHRHGSSLDFNGIHQEMIDNKIDAFSKAFLGLTVACARCHDHKLDAISQRDYYALAGIFMTPRWTPRAIALGEVNAATIAALASTRDAIREAIAAEWVRAAGLLDAASLRRRLSAEGATGPAATLDDTAYPLARIIAAGAGEGGDASAADTVVVATWQAVAAEWRAAREARIAANARFRSLVDPAAPGLPAGWVAEGEGVTHGMVDRGTIRVSLEGESLVAGLLSPGIHTHALSPRLPGVLRLPAPESFPARWVSVRVAGGEWAARLVVPQNALLNEGNGGPTFLDGKAPPQWMGTTATPLKNGVTRVLTELATTDFNPNFPPRTGLATAGGVTLPASDDGVAKRSWFSVSGIVAHDEPGAPQDDLGRFGGLLDRPEPTSAVEAWALVAAWLRAAVERFAAGDPHDGDLAILEWMLARGLLPNEAAALPDVAALVRRYREIEAALLPPRTANGMDERAVTPIDYRLNIRGNVDDEGAAVPRGFLEVFSPAAGSVPGGRLELAEILAGTGSPQTARVYVNRVWQWVFGTGLVATPSDFGRLGDRPSHPELLDRLAIDFMHDGWSTKRLVRRLVLSETFRQGSKPDATAVAIDPGNRLLHHHPTRRLGAEAIRDSILAVSGRLDPAIGGRPIRPHRVAEDPAKRLFSGPLDGAGRRSIYLEMSIMAPPAFLVGFNLPAPKIPTGRRDVTSVPAQALILMNDPFVLAMADHWAGRLLSDGRSDPADRMAAMLEDALGRPADAGEIGEWLEAVASFAPPGASPGTLLADRPAWAAVAHALFNTKEFLHHR